jgi:hypothetical protein
MLVSSDGISMERESAASAQGTGTACAWRVSATGLSLMASNAFDMSPP